jgi:hypothetical protein
MIRKEQKWQGISLTVTIHRCFVLVQTPVLPHG